MAANVERTPQVAVDLDEIWLAIATDNATAADRVLGRILEAAQRLGEFPQMGKARDELRPGCAGGPWATTSSSTAPRLGS